MARSSDQWFAIQRSTVNVGDDSNAALNGRPAVRVRPVHSCVAVLAIVIAAAPSAAAWASADDQDILVHVQRDGADVTVDVDCPVQTSIAVAWAVLTDYDHMAQFISNLQYSAIQTRENDKLQIYQKGETKRGLLKFAFESVREIQLLPYEEIRSRLISGDLKASEFTTRIRYDGAMVHVTNNGRYTPRVWIPPIIGVALIEAETRKQFGEIRAEMLRRSVRSTD